MILADRPHKNKIRSTRFSCWILKATDTHSECVTLTALTQENGYTETPQYYVIYKLPVIYILVVNCQFWGKSAATRKPKWEISDKSCY
jgi:hypothetical protein